MRCQADICNLKRQRLVVCSLESYCGSQKNQQNSCCGPTTNEHALGELFHYVQAPKVGRCGRDMVLILYYSENSQSLHPKLLEKQRHTQQNNLTATISFNLSYIKKMKLWI